MDNIRFGAASAQPIKPEVLNHKTASPFQQNNIQFRIGSAYLKDFTPSGIERFVKDNQPSGKKLDANEVKTFIQRIAENAGAVKNSTFDLADSDLGLRQDDGIGLDHLRGALTMTVDRQNLPKGQSTGEMSFVDVTKVTFDLKEKETKIKSLQGQVKSLNDQLKQAKETHSDLVDERGTAEDKIGDKAQQRTTELENKIKTAKTDLTSTEEAIGQYEKQLSELKSNTTLSASDKDKQTQMLNRAIRGAKEDITQIKSDIGKLTEQYKEKHGFILASRYSMEELSQLNRKVENAQARVNNLDSQLKDKLAELDATVKSSAPEAQPATAKAEEKPTTKPAEQIADQTAKPQLSEEPTELASETASEEFKPTAQPLDETSSKPTPSPVATEAKVEVTGGATSTTTTTSNIEKYGITVATDATAIPEGAILRKGKPFILNGQAITASSFTSLSREQQFHLLMKCDSANLEPMLKSIGPAARAEIKAMAHSVVTRTAYQQHISISSSSGTVIGGVELGGSAHTVSGGSVGVTHTSLSSFYSSSEDIDRAREIIAIINRLDPPTGQSGNVRTETNVQQTTQVTQTTQLEANQYWYSVKPGDTPLSIAKNELKNELRVQEIYKLNPQLEQAMRRRNVSDLHNTSVTDFQQLILSRTVLADDAVVNAPRQATTAQVTEQKVTTTQETHVQVQEQTAVSTPKEQPKVEPKVETPKEQPKVEPKVETPKEQPRVEPKVETPKEQPRVEPKVETPKQPPPRVKTS